MADIASKEFLTSIFIGLLFTSIFYGGAIGQTAWYFSLYKRDSEWRYLLVATLLLLDTAHVIVFSVAAYYVFLSWLNPLGALDTTTWSLPTTIAITYALTFIVQCFFILRIWTLSQKNKAIIACITILVMVQIASGMGTFILLRIEPKILFDSMLEINLVAQETRSPIFDITTRTKIAAAIELSSSLVADLAITATLVFYLYRGRSVTKFAFAANSVINRLMCFALSTGLLTSLVALVNLVLFLSAPNSFSWLALQIVSSKLYVNSLLATFVVSHVY
ncbi:hypothetical protein DFH11DRAFT_1631018 [Phellopilus nigrolimitatus]|nr:hypothetical protein DFH11DRAFT_1631018 [Phellopilus nigrolimitatus]